MALSLHKAGLLTAVWNRTRAKAESIQAETGVQIAESPADLASRCDVIITCVSADQDLVEVVHAMQQGLKPGVVIIDTSTVSVETEQSLSEELKSQQVELLDAPVSGGVEGARKGTLSIMVGGKEEVLEKVRPVLEAISARIVHMGPVGSGQATKAVNQIMAAGINQAVCEALAFGEAMGLDQDKVIEVVSGGAAGNWFLQHRGPTMTKGVFDPGFKLALHHKDLELCRSMAESVSEGDKRLPIIEMTLIHYRRLMEAGFADEDISALYRLKKELFAKEY
jgi:3-hydroxyisobutyrate dehydrogenase